VSDVPIIEFEVDGQQVQVPDDGSNLLGTLRDYLDKRSAKDGCSPQGQCGCCTVLIDGQPRVACVTPTRRVKGRSITTLEGFSAEERARWGGAFCATGASQCGFCTPGIIVRLAGLEEKKPDATEEDVQRALSAHLCRCTGWQTIIEAWNQRDTAVDDGRDLDAAAQRAELEGGNVQAVSISVALGDGGFADDRAPADALVAVLSETGEWVVGESLHQARTMAGKVQGRRTTLEPSHPVAVPDGEWAATLQTSWVDPAYLETDAAWALPGEPAVSPLTNGGAFGGKVDSSVTGVAERLATEHGRAVRVLYSREDSIRLGAKRPPVAGGAHADGTGVLHVVATPGIDEAIAAVAPGLAVEHVQVPTELRTSSDIRGAGWVEAVALVALATGELTRVQPPGSGWAEATVNDDGITVQVGAGAVLDEVVLRSYCIGAAHMGYSLVMGEALAVDQGGIVKDLTVRSFGVVRAADTPTITIEITDDHGPAVNVSDAVFAAVAAATALHVNATAWPHG